jgi:hypothetical protein
MEEWLAGHLDGDQTSIVSEAAVLIVDAQEQLSFSLRGEGTYPAAF